MVVPGICLHSWMVGPVIYLSRSMVGPYINLSRWMISPLSDTQTKCPRGQKFLRQTSREKIVPGQNDLGTKTPGQNVLRDKNPQEKSHRDKIFSGTKCPQDKNVLGTKCPFVIFSMYDLQRTMYNEQKTLLYKGGYKFIMVENR